MPVVIAFADCIARPDEGDRRFGLAEHLEAVACACGRADGSPEERLAFLAGLLHDAAKATPEWQIYIRPGGPRKGPPHAPLGAAFFAYWADDLVPRWAGSDRVLRRRFFDLALDWTRLVYDHHGGIKDLAEDPPWLAGSGGTGMQQFADSMDQAGLCAFVRRFFPDALDLSGFRAWLGDFDGRWRERWQFTRAGLLDEARRARGSDDVPLAEEGLRLARLGGQLIFADRRDAAEWEPEEYPAARASEAADSLEGFIGERAVQALSDGANPELVAARGRLNAAALAGYRDQSDARVFALLLPTGFGKTLTGLRVALEACRTGRCRRIVYVAPYLSILSQAAREISHASGQEVFVHHHLTAATLEDHQPYDVMDTWQAPIVATTFNQLFRALFPARAQQCLRRPALEGAFLLIDEPQIVGREAWNLFLRALAVATREARCQALLMTATLPPADSGLGAAPVELVGREVVGTLPADRYVIRLEDRPWDAGRTAREARRRLASGRSVAVILNTIRDACDVFRRVTEGGAGRWRFLAAAMLPGHKAKVIAEVRRLLRRRKAIGVVCTQVLEAGVDLSFQSLLRALPVFPSVVQAAGRANRHGGAREPAEVVVFDYRRTDDKPSRQFIYRSEATRQCTDAVLARRTPLAECEVPAALVEYFEALWSIEPATASLPRFELAARGAWSKLAGLEPFDGDDGWREDVYVPHTDGDRYLPYRMARLLYRWAPGGPAELLARYQDRTFRRSLTFRQKKQLSALLHQFTVTVPQTVATEIAAPTGLEWLRELANAADYSEATGLAHLLGGTASAAETVII
jgi:CRISPR-associated helicase Cas3/CRISPR-associated endonuclease Cas3-HD